MPNVLKCAWAPTCTSAVEILNASRRVLDQPDMIEPRTVADRRSPPRRGPDRPRRPRRRRSSRPASRRDCLPSCSSERVKHRRRRAAVAICTICSGFGQHGAVGDARSPRRRSSSRCSARPSDRRCRARAVGRRCVAGVQRVAQRCGSTGPAPSSPSSDSFGANTPSTSTSRRTPSIACSFSAAAARASAAASGAARQRQHLAHQRAQVGVLPVLDPPVRQAEALDRRRRRRGGRSATLPAPGSRASTLGEGRRRDRVRRLGLRQCDVHRIIRSSVRPPRLRYCA